MKFLSLLGTFLFAVQLLSPNAIAAKEKTRGATFKLPIELQATLDQPYELDLRSLLNQPGVPPYLWSAKNLPAGITLDAKNNRLVGTPNTIGTANIELSVADSSGEAGDRRPGTFKVLPVPPQFAQDKIDLGIQNEGNAWSFELKDYIKDMGVVTEFEADGLPAWISLDAKSGKLSGTPKRKDVGKYTGVTFRAVGLGGTSTMTAFGEVLITIIQPKWTQKVIELPDQPEEKPFQFDATQYVSNPEGFQLQYQVVNMTPPLWMKVGLDSGTLFGTPPKEGKYEITVSFKGVVAGVVSDSTLFKINVPNVNKPPRWKANPIDLGTAYTAKPFSQGLAASAEDLDGEPLAFTMTGPAWAKMDATTGVFSGTPGKSDIGAVVEFKATVTDPNGASDTTTLRIAVVKSNEAPYWLAHPTILPEGSENISYEVDLTALVTDPDGDKLTFKKVDQSPLWPEVSANGTLAGIPKTADIGLHKFRISVSDGIAGSDTAEVQILVKNVNDPPVWVINPIQFTVDEDSTVSKDISAYAQDPDAGDSLIYTIFSGPQWVSISQAGVISGVPRTADVGINNVVVRSTDKGGLTADVGVIITVKPVNHKPYWTQNPIQLPQATEDTAYKVNLLEYAKDQDVGDVLSFFKLTQYPKWLTLSETGELTGTPKRVDVGLNSFEIRVMDKLKAEAVATIKIEVMKLNHAPRWRQNPIAMPDGHEDVTYTSFKLGPYAIDDDGDAPLKFEKVTGPEWLFVGEDGSVTGLPPAKSEGAYTAEFKVSDPGGLSATVTANLKILHTNHPPVINPTMPVFTVTERQSLEADLKEFVSDLDEDAIHFTLIDSVAWLAVSAEGKLVAKPQRKEVGTHSINFKVDDGQLMVPGVLKIKVLKDPRPPVWNSEPIARFEAKTNMLFSAGVRDKAKDLDGEPLRFEKKSGPTWLAVDTSGGLNGTPKDADLGENAFLLAVCNLDLCTNGTLYVDVKLGLQNEDFAIDQPHPGAKSEQLWVVDNSDKCDRTIRGVKNNIQVFYDALKAAGIVHTAVVLSGDVKEFSAYPIHAKNKLPLLKHDDENWLTEFRQRVDLAYSSGWCNNCNNSPIWAKYRFYEQAPNWPDIYHNGYFTAGVPTETLIMTHQMDHYKYYTRKLPAPLNTYAASDFLREFLTFHKEEQQPYRVSAIAPECPKLYEESGDPSSAPEPGAYRLLTNKTGGAYYTSGCNLDLAATLRDYAAKVIFRAYVHANTRYKLTKVPLDLSTVKVILNGVELHGNTGGNDDTWTYDAATNTITVNWTLIDEGQLKPGDKLTIQYRVS